MEWRSAIGRHWGRWSDAMKRELLREPDRILLDRGPDAVAPAAQDRAEILEPSLDLR
ncbi:MULTISPECIES: hypothetical protein [Sphingobium]|uniref:hypothetical protein n=1 Tax=Sphingobium TaxID=165695 RepID=UPI00159C3C71|nr:hypothetical protein [Sphingobium sp. 15-1]